jgi:hypothetical protein
LYSWLKLPEPRTTLHYLVLFDSKVFVYIKGRLKLDKVSNRAFIGWHCEYESTNIYRVWVPSQHRIMSIRDITFNPSQRYRLDETVEPYIEQLIHTLEVPSFDGVEVDVMGLSIQWPLQHYETTLETYRDTIIVDSP